VLNNLKKTNWQKPTLTSDEPIDIPTLMRNLASDDIYTRGKAMYDLYNNIWYQGRVYAATAFVVPFLIELLQAPSIQDKDGILVLLAHIARGRSSLAVQPRSEEERYKPEFRQKREPESAWMEDAHNATRHGVETYLALLENDDPKIRICAPYTLACFQECSAQIIPTLLSLLEKEKDQQVKASMILSLEDLVENESEYLQLFEDIVRSKEAGLVRLAAAMALARQAKDKTPAASMKVLVDAIARPELIADLYDELPWANGSIVADASATLRNLKPSMAKFAIPVLIKALATVGVYSALSVTQTLLYLAFDGKNITFQDLTSEQKMVLKAIANNNTVWKSSLQVHQDRLAG